MSKLENRFSKTIKKRTAKSPLSSTAAETLLLLTKPPEKSEIDLNSIIISHKSFKRNNSELLKKGLKSQNSDYLKVLNEKSQEIKKLQEENQMLASQHNEFTNLLKKYHKLRNLLKQKDQVIESLKNLDEKRKGFPSNDIEENYRTRKGSVKVLNKNMFKIKSRLSLDMEYQPLETYSERPSTVINRGISTKSSPSKPKRNLKIPTNNTLEIKKLLGRTEKILKGWKKAYKNKSN